VRFRYAVASNVGLVRRSNEDSFLARDGLFAVCDGMGGARGGEVASETACRTLLTVDPRTAGPDTLREAVMKANTAIVRRSLEEDRLIGMGTTLTAALGLGDRLVFAHVGDSRGYLLHDGELRQVTSDHSWVGEMIRRGELTPAQAAVHPHRSVITRALGTEGVVRPDILEVPVVAGDRLVLCSDGLSGMVLDPLIQELTKVAADPQQAADSLVEAALEAGGDDNVTVVVVFIGADAAGGSAGAGGSEDLEDTDDGQVAAASETVLIGPVDRGLDAEGAGFGRGRRYGSGVRRKLSGRALLRPVRVRSEAGAATAAKDEVAEGGTMVDGGAADEGADGADGSVARRGTAGSAGPAAGRGDASPMPPFAQPPAGVKGRWGWSRRRWALTATIVILVIVIAVAGFAVYNSSVYYVGVHKGNLALFNGLPGSVLGIELSSVVEEGQVPYSVLQPALRAQVDAHAHVTKEEGQRFIRSLSVSP
jgi:protein phosphatase